MTISVADVVALKQQIAADRKKLEEREHALEVVAEMLREANADSSLDLDLESPAKTPAGKPNFTEAVRQSVHKFRDADFTVSNIESSLKADGVRMAAAARARIAAILHELTDKNVITRTRKGSGNKPNKYRLRPGSNGTQQAAA